MWKEIIGGAGFLAIMTLIIGIQNKKIDKMVNGGICAERCKNTDDNFEAIKEQQKKCQVTFKEIHEKLDKQVETLIKVETILSIAAKKNGWQ